MSIGASLTVEALFPILEAGVEVLDRYPGRATGSAGW
jgi:hypothetical protein